MIKQTADGPADNEQKSYLFAFLQPYPVHLYSEDEAEEYYQYKSLNELQAGLFRRPPTSCSTAGKMRPGGFNRSGKLVPSKWIPQKTDKRSGK
jgi:hypothetical protein